jgi:type II secretory pathway pseudopilin PulG
MNRRQKAILTNIVIVIIITAFAVIVMINFKDWVNRSEAMLAMEQLGKITLRYRKEHGSVPPQSYVDGIREDLPGSVRMGALQYRGLWIDFEASGDEILAYTKKEYPSSLLSDGFIVLRLDGRVEWMGEKEFRELLARQQSPIEIQMLQQ